MEDKCGGALSISQLNSFLLNVSQKVTALAHLILINVMCQKSC